MYELPTTASTAIWSIWLVNPFKYRVATYFYIFLFIHILAYPHLPYHMMYQPPQQGYMRPPFLPQYQLQQPQQIIGGDAFISGNNLTSSSTGVLQASVPMNSHTQHLTVNTSMMQYDCYSQQRSQVELYDI